MKRMYDEKELASFSSKLYLHRISIECGGPRVLFWIISSKNTKLTRDDIVAYTGLASANTFVATETTTSVPTACYFSSRSRIYVSEAKSTYDIIESSVSDTIVEL